MGRQDVSHLLVCVCFCVCVSVCLHTSSCFCHLKAMQSGTGAASVCSYDLFPNESQHGAEHHRSVYTF